MKQFFYLVIFSVFTLAAKAQTAPVANNIKASVNGSNLLLTWNEATAVEQGSWEVQASADGKSFTTIGLVWGADPKAAGNGYAFKQKTDKVQPKYQYFRVLYIADASKAVGSNTIRLSK